MEGTECRPAPLEVGAAFAHSEQLHSCRGAGNDDVAGLDEGNVCEGSQGTVIIGLLGQGREESWGLRRPCLLQAISLRSGEGREEVGCIETGDPMHVRGVYL